MTALAIVAVTGGAGGSVAFCLAGTCGPGAGDDVANAPVLAAGGPVGVLTA